MPPTQPSAVNPNDPDVIALSKAIFQKESGGDFNATGDAGTSHGAGQWQSGTWSTEAQHILGSADAPMTPQNQKAVIQGTIAQDKAAGLNPAQIAAKWNSGSPVGWENKVGTTTINGKQIPYNVPQYVKDVTSLYQQNKGQLQQAPTANDASATVGGYQPPTPQGQTVPQQSGNAAGYAPPTPPVAPVQSAQTPADSSDASGGFLSGLQEDIQGTNPNSIGTQLENTAKSVGNFLLPSIGDTYNDIVGKNNKTGLQQLGDAGSTLLGLASVIPGLDVIGAPLEAARGADLAAEGASKVAPGLLSSVAKNAGLGAAFGATGAVGQGDTNLGDIAKSTAEGAATGGALGGIGHGIGGLLSKEAGKTGEANLREFTTVRKTLNKALTDNSRPAGAMGAATDPISTLAQSGLLKDLKQTQGKLDVGALTNENGTGSIDNLIEGHSQDASNLIEQLPGTVPTEEARQAVLDEIVKNPDIADAGDVDKAENEVNRRFASFQRTFGSQLPYTKIDDIRVAMNKIYDPETRNVARSIGDMMRSYLYNGGSTNEAIRSSMANEAELIRARNYLQKLHGTPMGKGMQKIAHEIIGSGIGGTIGSIGGPIGAGLGAAATGAATKAAEDALSGNKFNPIGAKVAGGLLNASKKKLPQIAGRIAKVGLIKAANGI